MKNTMLVLIGCGVLCASAETWNGSQGSAWSLAGNWDTLPGAGSALIFAGTQTNTVNDFANGTAFSGISFASGASPFTLTGNAIAFAGPIINASTSMQTVALPLTLTDTLQLQSTNGNMTLAGVISGTGNIIRTGSDTSEVLLTNANTFVGSVIASNGLLVVRHSAAFGDPSNVVYQYGTKQGAICIRGDKLNIRHKLVLNEQRMPGYRYTITSDGGSNEISGPIQKEGTVRLSASGTRLIVSGGIEISSPGVGGDLVMNNSCDVTFISNRINLGSANFWGDSGQTTLAVSNNIWGKTVVANGPLVLGIANALPYVAIDLGIASYAPSGSINLNGYNLTIPTLNCALVSGTRRIYSTPPATFTLNQSANTTYWGTLEGAVSFVKDGSGTFTLTNGTWTTSGQVCVSNGTLRLAAGSSFGTNCLRVSVSGASSRLHLATTNTIANNGAVYLENSGKLEIADTVVENIDVLYLDGVAQLAGTYGSSTSSAQNKNDTYFAGRGILIVANEPIQTPNESVWTAQGVSPLATITENWQSGLPVFSNALAKPIFALDGKLAVFPESALLYGMLFTATNNFSLSGESLSLGKDGVRIAVNSTKTLTYSITNAVVARTTQTWALTNASTGSITLQLLNGITAQYPSLPLTVSGFATLDLWGTSTIGEARFKTGMVVRVYSPTALGDNQTKAILENGARVELNAVGRIEKPFDLINGDASTGYAGQLRNMSGSNILAGAIYMTGSRIKTSGTSPLEIEGPLTGGGALGADNVAGWIRFPKNPINTGSLYIHTGAGSIIFACTNNILAGQMEVGGVGGIRFDVANAFSRLDLLQQAQGASRVNLNGFDQKIGRLHTYTNGANLANHYVFSDLPATLTVDSTSNSDFFGALSGRVSFVKLNTNTQTFSGTNLTSGSFFVSNGTLKVVGTLGASATNIVVAGGTLLLMHSQTLSDNATLHVPSNAGKIYLTNGVQEAVRFLYLDGHERRKNTYGATGSGAAVIDDQHFTGQGKLVVLSDRSGVCLILR